MPLKDQAVTSDILINILKTIKTSTQILKDYQQKIVSGDTSADNGAAQEARKSLDTIFLELHDSAQHALTLFRNPTLFNQLTDEEKAMLAGESSDVMLEMLTTDNKDRQLERIFKTSDTNIALLDKVVASYILNISILHSCASEPNKSPEEIRICICITIAKNDALLNSLSVPTRLMLLSFIKQSRFLHDYHVSEKMLLSGTMNLDTRRKINKAYVMRTDYNPQSNWNNSPWPELLGYTRDQQIDYFKICKRLEETAFFKNGFQPKSPDESSAAAEVLVSHPPCSQYLTTMFKEATLRLRYELALYHFEAFLVISNNRLLRGVDGEITQEDIIHLADTHNYPNIDKYNELRAKQMNRHTSKDRRDAEIGRLAKDVDRLTKEKVRLKKELASLQEISGIQIEPSSQSAPVSPRPTHTLRTNSTSFNTSLTSLLGLLSPRGSAVTQRAVSSEPVVPKESAQSAPATPDKTANDTETNSNGSHVKQKSGRRRHRNRNSSEGESVTTVTSGSDIAAPRPGS